MAGRGVPGPQQLAIGDASCVKKYVQCPQTPYEHAWRHRVGPAGGGGARGGRYAFTTQPSAELRPLRDPNAHDGEDEAFRHRPQRMGSSRRRGLKCAAQGALGRDGRCPWLVPTVRKVDHPELPSRQISPHDETRHPTRHGLGGADDPETGSFEH